MATTVNVVFSKIHSSPVQPDVKQFTLKMVTNTECGIPDEKFTIATLNALRDQIIRDCERVGFLVEVC